MSVWRLSRTSGLSREQTGLERLKLYRGSPRHTWLEHHFQGQKFKGQLAGGGGILWQPPAQLVWYVLVSVSVKWNITAGDDWTEWASIRSDVRWTGRTDAAAAAFDIVICAVSLRRATQALINRLTTHAQWLMTTWHPGVACRPLRNYCRRHADVSFCVAAEDCPRENVLHVVRNSVLWDSTESCHRKLHRTCDVKDWIIRFVALKIEGRELACRSEMNVVGKM